MSTINVLVVDDSAFIRRIVSDIIDSERDMKVIGIARDGMDAIEKNKRLKPDVITMDIEMPKLNGNDALKEIMKSNPTKVIMLSSLTKKGAEITMECLSYGAFDFIEKPSITPSSSFDTVKKILVEKIRASKYADVESLLPRKRIIPHIETSTSTVKPENSSLIHTRNTVRNIASSNKLLLIASSTGGPRSLEKVIEPLPGKIGCPGIVIQHMPAGFTKSLADRLNKSSNIRVKEAEDGEFLENDTIYIAPGNYHLSVKKQNGKMRLFLDCSPKINNVRPAADFTFNLAAEIYGGNIVCAVLTGMGKDGADGAEKIKALGGKIIAESKETSVVYGMPKAVVDRGIADFVLDNTQIAEKIVSLL